MQGIICFTISRKQLVRKFGAEAKHASGTRISLFVYSTHHVPRADNAEDFRYRGHIHLNQKLPPPSESSMLRVAWSCCEGIKVLSKVPDSNTLIAFAIVASHGVETTLKCHLLQNGKSLNDCLKLGHNLLKTWDAAIAQGPPIEGPVPDWLRALNWGHDKPHAFRYLPDMYGIGAPRAEDLIGWWEPVLKSLYRTSSRL